MNLDFVQNIAITVLAIVYAYQVYRYDSLLESLDNLVEWINENILGSEDKDGK